MIFNSFKGPLGTDFGTIFGPKIDPKSVQKWSQERASKKTKTFKKPLVFQCFCGFGGSKIDQKSIKIVSESYLKRRSQNNTQKCPKKCPRWLQNRPKLGPCWPLKPSWTRPRAHKKRHPTRHQKTQTCECMEREARSHCNYVGELRR